MDFALGSLATLPAIAVRARDAAILSPIGQPDIIIGDRCLRRRADETLRLRLLYLRVKPQQHGCLQSTLSEAVIPGDSEATIHDSHKRK